MTESRRMNGAYSTHMREIRKVYKFLFRKPEGRHHLENLGIGWKIISEWGLKKYCFMLRIVFIWLRAGTSDALL
jgi:hypothetical protein